MSKLVGLISFQENIWIIIKQSLNLAKKKCNNSTTGMKFIMSRDDENEDMFNKIEWIIINIQGTKAQEEEEYNDSLKLYNPLTKIFKADIPKDANFRKALNTKLLTPLQLNDAYKQGYGCIGNNNLANKLLEMGILTHIEMIDDYNIREEMIPKPTTDSTDENLAEN